MQTGSSGRIQDDWLWVRALAYPMPHLTEVAASQLQKTCGPCVARSSHFSREGHLQFIAKSTILKCLLLHQKRKYHVKTHLWPAYSTQITSLPSFLFRRQPLLWELGKYIDRESLPPSITVKSNSHCRLFLEAVSIPHFIVKGLNSQFVCFIPMLLSSCQSQGDQMGHATGQRRV